MAYDSGRGRVVLFGGTGTSTFGDTWEYDGADWTRVATAASPLARTAHAMTYDPTVGAVVLFGGAGTAGAGFLADTWLYDGTNWTDVTATLRPPARVGAALAFEPTLGRSLLFGGGTFSRLNDTWTFDAQTRTWTQLQPNQSPSARNYHAMAVDPTRGCTVFGGYATTPLDDTWVFLPTVPTWTRLTPNSSPSARSRHAMVYDPGFGCLLFGGAAPTPTDDTWTFSGNTWTLLPAQLPPQRVWPSLCFDGRNGRLLLFGGHGAAPSRPLFDDTWELDGHVWRPILSRTRLPGQWYRAGAYDLRRARAVAFGGADTDGTSWWFFNDTWEFDGQDWVQRTLAGSPSPRCGHLTYDSWRGLTVMFGGWDRDPATGVFRGLDETWGYDGIRWTQIVTRNAPSARFAPLVFDAGRGVVMLFGGARMSPQGNPSALGETWEFDGQDWTLIPTPPQSTPSARYAHGIVYDPARGRVLMFGGLTTSGGFAVLDETWEYDGAAATWTLLTTTLAPPARGGLAMAHDPVHDRSVMLYGTTVSANWNPIGGIWDFHPAAVPAFARYGVGCAGSDGTPSLDAAPGSLPALGAVLDLDLTQLPNRGGTLLLGAGLGIGQFSGMPLPLDLGFAGMPGCDLWIGLDPAISIQHGFPAGGAHRISLQIPNVAALAGLQLALQAMVFDSAAPNGFASMSNAGIATIH
jgi:hypothetical protein